MYSVPSVLSRTLRYTQQKKEFSGRLKKVSERRDDAPEPEPERRPRREPGSYYYDDATGYETYSPEEDEDGGDGGEPPAREDS